LYVNTFLRFSLYKKDFLSPYKSCPVLCPASNAIQTLASFSAYHNKRKQFKRFKTLYNGIKKPPFPVALLVSLSLAFTLQ
jgi:hypothetical protein